MRNCVRVARQTLTLLVEVRVLYPQFLGRGAGYLAGQDVRLHFRSVAQFGRALRSGRRGRVFESHHLDQEGVTKQMSPQFFSVFMRVFWLLRADFSKSPHRGCSPPKRAKKAKNRFPNKDREAVLSIFRHRQRNDFRLSVQVTFSPDLIYEEVWQKMILPTQA